MNISMDEQSHNSNRLELMQVARNWTRFGLYFHIHKRGVIPSSFIIFYSETEKWESLKQELEQNQKWEADNRLEIREADFVELEECLYVLHIKEGITIVQKDLHKTVSVYFDSRSDMGLVGELKEKLQVIRKKVSKFRIGYVMQSGMMLDVKFQDFKPYEEDLTRFLGDEIITFRDAMLANLKQDDKSGLYLLHGKPGTGKTSFIKSVLSKIDKKVIYITPAQTDKLTSPQLIGLLMDYPNSVLIIEDAETVLMKRRGDNSNAVSNLLNLTDGFPADFMNLNIICTFNTPIDDIDPALLRKGRLKGIQEFTELSPEQAKKIASIMGKELQTDKPATLAEICNTKVDLKKFPEKEIGFINGDKD